MAIVFVIGFCSYVNDSTVDYGTAKVLTLSSAINGGIITGNISLTQIPHQFQ